ncbi:MAG: glutaredoxin family protein [Thermoanaerobaculia bacterium]
MSRYQLLTRPGCHLCDEMEEILAQVLPTHGLTYELVNVDGDPDLKRRYGEVIPVLLRDGKAVAKIRVEPDRLERIIRRKR